MIKYLLNKLKGFYQKLVPEREDFEVEFEFERDEFTEEYLEDRLYEQPIFVHVPGTSFKQGIFNNLLFQNQMLSLDGLIQQQLRTDLIKN